jgi:predicted transcriptional regulator
MAGELLTIDPAIASVPAQPPADSPRYKRITPEQRKVMRELRQLNTSQVAIAQVLGVSQSTVSKWLSETETTTADATEYFRAQAEPMARKIVAKGRPSDLIKVLEGIEVLSNQDVRGGLTIVIGSGSTVQVNVGVDGLSPSGIASGGEGVENR